MKTNKHNYKLTDEQFIEAYRAGEGNFSQISRYIQDRYKIPYSKQAVQDRAEKHPEEIEKQYRAIDNESFTGLMTFAEDETNDVKTRARYYVQVINKIKHRQRLKVQADKAYAKKKWEDEPEGVFEINGYTLHFPADENDLPPEQEQAWTDCIESLKKDYNDNNQELDAPPQIN